MIVRVRARVGLKGQLRRLPQSAGADHVERREPSLCTLKLFLGLAPAAGGTQQSNQRGLGGLVAGLEEAERPGVAQGFIGHILEASYQRRKEPHTKPSRLLTFSGAPVLKLLAVRQIQAFEEFAFERLRRLAQRIDRHGIRAASSRAPQRQDVDRDAIKIEPDVLAVGDDLSAAGFIDQRAQAGQTPPQRGTRIIRNRPEHGTEPVAAVRARGDGQIGEQRPRLFGRGQRHSHVVVQHGKTAQHGNAQQFFSVHGPDALALTRGSHRAGPPIPTQVSDYSTLTTTVFPPIDRQATRGGGIGPPHEGEQNESRTVGQGSGSLVVTRDR